MRAIPLEEPITKGRSQAVNRQLFKFRYSNIKFKVYQDIIEYDEVTQIGPGCVGNCIKEARFLDASHKPFGCGERN